MFKYFLSSFSKIFGFLAALLVFFLFIGGLSTYLQDNSNFYFLNGEKNSKNIIAIMKINGPIISNPENLNNFNVFNNINAIYPSQIEKFLNELETLKIKGLIVSIDSPGGSVFASNEIYALFKNFKKNNNITLYFHSSIRL